MTKLKMMAAIGASALMLGGTVATTASAQPWRHYERSYDDYGSQLTTSYVDSLEWRINNSPIPFGERRALLRELLLVAQQARAHLVVGDRFGIHHCHDEVGRARAEVARGFARRAQVGHHAQALRQRREGQGTGKGGQGQGTGSHRRSYSSRNC